MKGVFFLLVPVLFCQTYLFSQDREERKELLKLVNERQVMFDEYAASLKRKSGIFGQKTKNDLRTTHDKLKDIVEVDNKIMTRLRQLLEYSKFEKQTMSYDVNQYAEQLKNFERTQDTLLKQLARLEEENAKLNKSGSGFKNWIWFFLGIIVAVLFNVLRNKKDNRKKENAKGGNFS
ncbi:MAG TPA: hypothetical protein PKM97_07240 [Bacteroidia bacterium]|nr:hypothetical protein [Bacteroidia bacterium]